MGRVFPIDFEFESGGFCGGRKTGEPEKPSEQERGPTTNSIAPSRESGYFVVIAIRDVPLDGVAFSRLNY